MDIAEINPRKSEIDQNAIDRVSFVAMADVSEDGYISSHETLSLSEVYSSYTYFRKGDVLLAKITPCFENGKAAIADTIPNEIGFGSSEFHVLRTNGNVLPKYLFYALWNDNFRLTGSKKMTGSAGQKRVPTKFLKNHQIPLPTLDEQKAVVAKLDRAQRLIDIDKEMLAKYDELIQSVFLEMFGDPVTNPKGWEVKNLKELGDIQTGKTPSTKVDEYFEGDIPFVTPSDLGENSISPTRFLSNDGLDNSRKVRKGTTLVCCIGATIGKVGMTERISGFNQQINSIEWNNNFVLDEVGYQGMRFLKDEIKRNAKSTTLPILKKSLFEGLKFPVFEKGLQQKFVDIYYRVKIQMEETDKSLKKSEELFSSLVQEAFG